MRLTIRLLGTEVLHVSTGPEPGEDSDVHLSGGTLGSTVVEAGPTDWHMGFTMGMGGDG